MSRRKTKKKTETSKIILFVSYIIGIILTVLTVAGTIAGFDASPLVTVTGLAYAEIGVSNGFYYNKAKKENVMKIAIGFVESSPEKAEQLAAVVNAIGGIV